MISDTRVHITADPGLSYQTISDAIGLMYPRESHHSSCCCCINAPLISCCGWRHLRNEPQSEEEAVRELKNCGQDIGLNSNGTRLKAYFKFSIRISEVQKKTKTLTLYILYSLLFYRNESFCYVQ